MKNVDLLIMTPPCSINYKVNSNRFVKTQIKIFEKLFDYV